MIQGFKDSRIKGFNNYIKLGRYLPHVVQQVLSLHGNSNNCDNNISHNIEKKDDDNANRNGYIEKKSKNNSNTIVIIEVILGQHDLVPR